MMEKNLYNLSNENQNKLNDWLLKFPRGQKKPAIIYALHLIQKENKYIRSEHIDAVAKFLDIKKIDVYEVASFYSMFELNKTGKHTISVCTNISCMLSGSDKILSYIEGKLGIKLGETNENFFLKDERECLAACCGAPMMQIDHKYYENLTTEKIDKILNDIENEK